MKTFLRSFALIALGSVWLATIRAADSSTPSADTDYTPCKIHQKVTPVFPLRLLMNGILHGEVQLTFEVDALGHLTDSLVTAYTHREFADEVLRAVKQWSFEPGISKGRPVISVFNFTFNFETNGVAVIEKHGMPLIDSARSVDDYAYRAHDVGTLDHKPAAVHQPGPIYPKAWIDEGRTGSVVIDFFIDETGQARLPVIHSDTDTDNLLAASAVDAVSQWRFEPPTHRGHPVLARAQQTFIFKPKIRGETSS